MTLPNGTNQSRYLWLLLGAILLALVILWPLLGRRLAPSAQASSMAQGPAADAASLSPADAARRAFIASLGPIKTHPGVNAADYYKQAHGLYAQLSDNERNMFKGRPKDQDPKAAAALYAKIQPIMDLIRKGRSADYTDWGMAPATLDQWATPDPPIYDLADVGIWEAAYRFQTGEANGAIGDIAATEDMARDGSIDDTLHIQAVELLAQNALSLGDTSSYADLQDILDAPRQDLREATASLDPILQSYLDGYANPAAPGASMFQQEVQADSVTPQQEAAQIQWLLDASDQLRPSTLGQPDAQFEQTWAAVIASAPSTMQFGDVEWAQQLKDTYFYAQAEATANAMLAAGLALEQGDEARYESIPDPVTGQPFTYTQTPTGFQLQASPRDYTEANSTTKQIQTPTGIVTQTRIWFAPASIKLDFPWPGGNGGN